MPLIVKKNRDVAKLSVKLDAVILDEIEQYCSWANIELRDFIEHSANSILTADKEFKQQKNQGDCYA